VIEADLWKLAQARPGSELQFLACDAATGQAALRQQQAELKRLDWSMQYGH